MPSRLRSLVSFVALILFTAGAQSAIGAPSVINLSTRLKIETGGSVGIAGFVIRGTGVKPVLIRALGPSLTASGVAGVLNNPSMELYDVAGTKFGANDNWDQTIDIQTKHQTLGLALPQASESVIYAVLPPGAYTVIVSGVNNTTGVAIVEVYDMDTTANCSLINVATRGMVRTAAEVMIAGFVLRGTGTKDIVVRAVGPALQAAGVPNVLADPTIDVYNSSGTKIFSNDNWATQTAPATAAAITASGFQPTDSRESALVLTLGAGAYTVIMSGVGNSVGNAIVEVYDLASLATPAVNGQVYIASLRPVSGTTSTGSGDASMLVSADGLSATVNLPRYTGLSGAIVGAHIENLSGANLFDLNPNSMRADGTWLWTFAFTGGNLTAAQVADLIRTGQVVLRVYTDTNPTGELAGTFGGAAAGSSTFSPPAAPPALPGGTPADADASRFLTQATFGPTSVTSTTDRTSIAYVKNKGFSAWIDEQFTIPASTLLPAMPLPFADAVVPTQVDLPDYRNVYYTWWQRSVTAPDQLRQRVAYALSQILVVSTNSANLNDQPYSLTSYYDLLLNGAFGNFRTLLKDVTLHPAMGEFLDMLKNQKGTPNENYAREINQLFSIGLYQLYPDGTLQLDSRGLPVATYDQNAIIGFSRVFTGWSYADAGSNFFAGRPFAIGVVPLGITTPMLQFPTRHEPGAKTLLNGVVIPALPTGAAVTAASAAKDLDDAIACIFAHPNVGPFLARQLIQRLVTSNPSPGYIYRVSRKFDDNGSGVRGDLKAVVKAILTDYEARTTATLGFPGTGKQQEPVLRTAKVLRAFGATSVSGKWIISGTDASLGMTPLGAPTVFNFFAPDYIAPGDLANSNLYSPEFDITNESTLTNAANTLRAVAFDGIGGGGNDRTKLSFNINTTTDPWLAQSINTTTLVDQFNLLLMSGQMPTAMRDKIATAVALTNSGGVTTANQLERVRTAVHLIITSPQFSTQR